MPKLVWLALASMIAVAGLIAYRVGEPPQYAVEADTTDVELTIAAGIQALALALTPTETPPPTPTPTRNPTRVPATERPTYGPDASPGRYIVLAPTAGINIVEEIWCAEVTPSLFIDQKCTEPEDV
jgi:hypothetical protein